MGSHLAIALLKEGHKVTALKSHDSDLKLLQTLLSESRFETSDIDFIEGRLSDHSALDTFVSGSELVFHCAAKVSFWKKDRELLYETNVTGTRNLVNAMLKTGAKNLIYLSSIAALGRDEFNPGAEITIDNQWNESPYNTHYAESKHLAELEVWRGSEEGLNVSVLLPGVIMGAGLGKKSSAQILHMASAGNKYYPKGSNGFVSVEDLVRLMLFVWQNNLWKKRMLAVSTNMDYYTLLSACNTAFGKPVPSVPIKSGLLKVAVFFCRMLENLHLPAPAPHQALMSTSYNSRYRIDCPEGFTFNNLANEIPTLVASYLKRNS